MAEGEATERREKVETRKGRRRRCVWARGREEDCRMSKIRGWNCKTQILQRRPIASCLFSSEEGVCLVVAKLPYGTSAVTSLCSKRLIFETICPGSSWDKRRYKPFMYFSTTLIAGPRNLSPGCPLKPREASALGGCSLHNFERDSPKFPIVFVQVRKLGCPC